MANLTINDGGIVINTKNIASADLRYGPYGSLAEAKNATSSVQAEGLTVGVREDGIIVEYWYRMIVNEATGNLVLDLVKKAPEFKTINEESILGHGNIDVTAKFANGVELSSVDIDEEPNINNENNVVTSKGIATALKDLQDQINEMSKDVYPLTIDFTSSLPSPATWTGEALDTTLIWRTLIDDELVTPERVVIKQNGDEIYSGSPQEGTGHVNATIRGIGTAVFTIEATAGGMTKRRDISVVVVLPSYVGFYADANANLVTMRASLNVNTIDNVNDLSGTYYLDGVAASYLTLAVPSGFKITEITSSGFSVPLMVQGAHGEYEKEDNSVTIAGEPVIYEIYRSLNKIAPGPMTIKVY